MTSRGRKSAASLTIVTPLPGQRAAPPPGLPAAQAATWRAVAASKPAEWFSDDILALLAQYCRHVATADFLQQQIDAMEFVGLADAPATQAGLYRQLLKDRDRESKAIVAQARAMRLTPQSRYKAETANTAHQRANGGGAKRPWQA